MLLRFNQVIKGRLPRPFAINGMQKHLLPAAKGLAVTGERGRGKPSLCQQGDRRAAASTLGYRGAELFVVAKERSD